MNRRSFLRTIAGSAAALFATGVFGETNGARPNFLLITADDMNYDALGVVGCKTPDITPNLDRLAREGVRFEYAHITIAVCQPSRSVLMTGRYPHRNGAMGFEPIHEDTPTLQESLVAAGYTNGILGKVSHLAPMAKFHWDLVGETKDLGNGRDPLKYYQHAKRFFEQASVAGKPFFLMANSHDPHRPFAGSEQEKQKARKRKMVFPSASRYYRPDEVEVPGFLPDLPEVRREIAQYYSSVHRCDETVGEVLRALEGSGMADNTLVMFLSDNGMALPFAKTNCYLTSTKTPWIVRWPEKVKPGKVDAQHFVSGIDFMPTILQAAELPQVAGMDGTSFLPVLLGDRQPQRDHVVTVFHETSGKREYPMRCIQGKRFGYLFNAWTDGETVFKNESQSGLTMKAMKVAAQTDEAIAARVKLFLYRVPEEFYDFSADPNALKNLIGDPAYGEDVKQLRGALLAEMARTQDPLLEKFRQRIQPPSR